MSSISQVLLMKALDGLHARSAVSAFNIANAGTPGFRPSHVSFETALVRAAAGGPTAIAGVQPLARSGGADGTAELRLDLELATASSTAMRYAALIDVLGRQMRIAALGHAEIR